MVETVFYDGACGFCHRSVRFIVERDPEGRAFRFAPIDGETFRARLPAEERAGLPDSLIVMREDGDLLLQSDATVHILRRLQGGWALLAALLALVPRRLRDVAYAAFARNRHRLFERPTEVCPILAPALRERFDP